MYVERPVLFGNVCFEPVLVDRLSIVWLFAGCLRSGHSRAQC